MNARVRAAIPTVLALLVAMAGCRASPPATPTVDPAESYRLRPPSELSPDVVVEQHVTATKDGKSGGFDAVVQKRGDELLLVGLGPMGVRAFVLRQQGSAISYEQRLGPTLPFSPKNVLVDVHRAFFKRLAEPQREAAPDGVWRGTIDDEEVVETWRAGVLVERRFGAPGQPAEAVRVVYGPGCRVERCEPATIDLVSERHGYRLAIENRRFHRIP